MLLRTLVVLVAFGVSLDAWGQPIDGELTRPASPGDVTFSSVETTRQTSNGAFALGLRMGWTNDSWVAVDGEGDRVGSVLHNRIGAHLSASMGLGRFELGAHVPLIMYQDSEGMPAGIDVGGAGLGDARLVAKTRLMAAKGMLPSLSTSLAFMLPTAFGPDMGGADTPSAFANAIADWRVDKLRAAANLGFAGRATETLGNLEVGPALTYGLGLALDLDESRQTLVSTELVGEVGGGSAVELPVEARIGAQRRFLDSHWVARAFYGRGLENGYGAPDHRGLLQIVWQSQPDGPRADAPLVEPVPVSPPAVAKIPPNPDRDQDGIRNEEDGCPDDAEDFDGFEDTDGCPEKDNDGDGLLDADDRCPVNAEDVDGYEDQDGCPDPDNDFDGILDVDDACPIEQEVINGVDDDDGCPDEGKVLVVVGTTKIEIKDRVYFAHNSDEILPKSEPLLQQLAKTIIRTPRLKKIEVAGHTDDRGDDSYNLDLSNRRAASVREGLIRLGVDASRLSSTGYGETQPIDTNKTLEGRASNRRVEFIILEQTPSPVQPAVKPEVAK